MSVVRHGSAVKTALVTYKETGPDVNLTQMAVRGD